MSRQYNMYNVQLSEFWKQRVNKEQDVNTPYLYGSETGSEIDDSASMISRVSGVSGSRISVASTNTRREVCGRP